MRVQIQLLFPQSVSELFGDPFSSGHVVVFHHFWTHLVNHDAAGALVNPEPVAEASSQQSTLWALSLDL